MLTSFFYASIKKDNYKKIHKIFSLTISISQNTISKILNATFECSENGILPHCIMQMIFADTA